MKNTKIIAAFPACGKTYYFKNKAENISVLDSDSSTHYPTEERPDLPDRAFPLF